MVTELMNDAWQLAQGTSITTKVVATLTAVLLMRWATKKRYKLPPGPRPLPLLGNILELNGVSVTEKAAELKDKYGSVVTFYCGPKMIVILNDIETMTEAYVKRGSDFSSRPLLYSISIFTDGFKDFGFAPYGEVWRIQRKIASQALRQYLIGKQLELRIHEILQPLTERMKQESGAFRLDYYIPRAVFNVVHGICFGASLRLDDPKFEELLTTFDKANEVLDGLLEDYIPPLRWWPTKKFRVIMEENLKINDYVLNLVRAKRERFNPDRIESLTDNILLVQQQTVDENEKVYNTVKTDDHIKQIVEDVFVAGVDTSRFTLLWFFMVLVTYPDVQRKIQEEIDRVVGDAIPGKEHRSKLVYTEAVLMETMRLYYVAPMGVPRETIKDTTVGGYEIPAQVTVMSNFMAMMRDPNHWPDPLEFKPERFIATSEDGVGTKLVGHGHDRFVPFSVGHRGCMGESLARLELVYIIVGLLQKLTFTFASDGEQKVPDPTPIERQMGYLPKPYSVRVTSREKPGA